MGSIDFLKHFLRESSRLRQTRHCRNLELTIEDCPPQPNGASFSSDKEYMSSIVLWGGSGRIKLKSYFDLDTAAAWASRGLQVHESDLEDSIAIDFFREFSNLQAGYLRGVFESGGVQMSLSLPFVASGASEDLFEIPVEGRVESITWRMSDGDRSIVCTAEVEITDAAAFLSAQPVLEEALKTDLRNLISGDTCGDVEFFAA